MLLHQAGPLNLSSPLVSSLPGQQSFNSAVSKVRKADPVPASTWKASHHRAGPLNLSSPLVSSLPGQQPFNSAVSKVRKSDPVPASTWKASHHRAGPLNLTRVAAQVE